MCLSRTHHSINEECATGQYLLDLIRRFRLSGLGAGTEKLVPASRMVISSRSGTGSPFWLQAMTYCSA